jgi:hypothetical protein
MDTPLIESFWRSKSLLSDQVVQSRRVIGMLCKNKDLIKGRIQFCPLLITEREELAIKVVNVPGFDFGPVYFKFRSEFFKDGFLHDL